MLQNRGACFSVQGASSPASAHTTRSFPGMLLRGGALLGPFGVMGGFIQAQAHVQLVSGLVDDGLDPQAALDRPRFCVDGDEVRLEEGLWARRTSSSGSATRRAATPTCREFGGGQVILHRGRRSIGGSDPRKDGYAAGF